MGEREWVNSRVTDKTRKSLPSVTHRSWNEGVAVVIMIVMTE